MRSLLPVVALSFSLLSLGLQTRKPKAVSPLDKFIVPARLSELEYRRDRADLEMFRETSAMRDGVGVPFIRQITEDRQQIIIRAFVSEKYLPKTYDQRKETLSNIAWPAYGSVVSAFDLKFEDPTTPAVIVEFMSTSELAKGGKGHALCRVREWTIDISLSG